MHSQLRLTPQDPDLTLQPDTLLSHLEKSVSNLDQLLNDLHCTADDLQQTLDDPNTAHLLSLKAQVAGLQLKLLAIKYIPHAFAKLVTLMNESQKPEVGRRACATVLQIAGIPTKTAPNQAPPVSNFARPEQKLSDEQELDLLASLASVNFLKRRGMDLQLLHDLIHDNPDDIMKFLSTLTTRPKTKTTTPQTQ